MTFYWHVALYVHFLLAGRSIQFAAVYHALCLLDGAAVCFHLVLFTAGLRAYELL